MSEPAAIRFNNPGAMWGKGNPIAKKWGATGTTMLNDGLGQGNNIAFFPTKLDGACAQFDLWRSGYCNRTLQAAITKWSGGNWSQPYANFLTQQTGLTMGTQVTEELLASPRGWRLMKAQAQWEAGKPYPLTDTEWQTAQRRVFSNAPVRPTAKKGGAIVGGAVVGGGAAAKAASSGHHWTVVAAVFVVAVVIGGVVAFIIHKRHEKQTVAQPQPIEGHP